MDSELVAKRIEIATRSLLLFTTEEISNKGMADRKKITDTYNEIKEGVDSLEDSLKKARIKVIKEILEEEEKNVSSTERECGGPTRGENIEVGE